MTKLTVPLATLGLVLLAGLALGWSLHARQFNHRQLAWLDSVKVAHVRTDMALRESRLAKAEADSLRGVAAGQATEAQRLEAANEAARRHTAGAEAALAGARTTLDSMTAYQGLVPALRAERDTALAAGAGWHAAYQAEQLAAGKLAVRGDSLERVVQRQDSLLQVGTTVVGSSGCRIPILGVKCPEVVVGYGFAGELSGGTVTLHRGVAVTAGWRVL